MKVLAALCLLACAAGSVSSAGDAAREEVGLCEGGARPIGTSVFLPSRGSVSLPIAIVAGGAQRWDRYGNLPDQPWGHYRDIAVALSEHGAAAVLYDKSGTGATVGPPPSFEARVAEVVQVARCARARSDVGPLVLVGHSQGAAVVVAAATEIAPAALVLLSPGAGMPEVPAGVPVTRIQPASEVTAAWHPVVIPGVNHLLLPQPAVAGVTHVAPEALDAIVAAVLGVRP